MHYPQMASILNVTDSAYYPCFKGMFKAVVAALNEALDITLHLMPLTGLFNMFDTTDFTDVRPLFPPLLHTICLVYSTSKHYNSSARYKTYLSGI